MNINEGYKLHRNYVALEKNLSNFKIPQIKMQVVIGRLIEKHRQPFHNKGIRKIKYLSFTNN